MTLNKNYQRINGATDQVSDIDDRYNTAMTEIEADMTTIDSHLTNVSNPHTVTKTQVGLGNVDNTSDANKPVSTATQTALDGKVDENVAIVAGTKTKITYDTKRLVTSGTDATTADIADSTDKRYCTDAEKVVIGNTSGTNSGDQTISDATISLTDITDNNASTTKHGFLKKLSNNAAQFMNGVGDWATPAGAGDVAGPATNTDNYIPQWDGANSKTLKDGKAAPTGDIVGTSDTQELTNKTITTPTMTLADTAPTADGSVGFDRTNENLVIGDGSAGQLIHTGAWNSYTPTWTNVTVGNGTVVAKYCKTGKLVHVSISLTLGPTSSISGGIVVSLPFTAATRVDTPPIGLSKFTDSGGSSYAGLSSLRTSNHTDAIAHLLDVSGTYPTIIATSATVPFTFGELDAITMEFNYEAV